MEIAEETLTKLFEILPTTETGAKVRHRCLLGVDVVERGSSLAKLFVRAEAATDQLKSKVESVLCGHRDRMMFGLVLCGHRSRLDDGDVRIGVLAFEEGVNGLGVEAVEVVREHK